MITELETQGTNVFVSQYNEIYKTGFSFDLNDLTDKELDKLFTTMICILADRVKKEYI